MDAATIAMLSAFLTTNAGLAVAIIVQRRNHKNGKNNPHHADCLMVGRYVLETDCFDRTRDIMEKVSENSVDLGKIKGKLDID